MARDRVLGLLKYDRQTVILPSYLQHFETLSSTAKLRMLVAAATAMGLIEARNLNVPGTHPVIDFLATEKPTPNRAIFGVNYAHQILPPTWTAEDDARWERFLAEDD